jgi:hypothetical protein
VSLMAAILRDLAQQDAKSSTQDFRHFGTGQHPARDWKEQPGLSTARRRGDDRDFQPRRLWRATRSAPSNPEPVGGVPFRIDFDPLPRSVLDKASRNNPGPAINTGERINAFSHRLSARQKVSHRSWRDHP